jgi:hypothetical protein
MQSIRELITVRSKSRKRLLGAVRFGAYFYIALIVFDCAKFFWGAFWLSEEFLTRFDAVGQRIYAGMVLYEPPLTYLLEFASLLIALGIIFLITAAQSKLN